MEASMAATEANKIKMIDYYDFGLLLEQSGEDCRARVEDSPAGQAEARFSIPFDKKDLEIFKLKIGQTHTGMRAVRSPELELAKEYGTRLFRAVFVEDVLAIFRSSQELARNEGKGLRIKLRIASPMLAAMPWEYLFDPTVNRFLSLGVETPVVRYLDLPEPIRPFRVTPPIKILVIISSPNDLTVLDLESEWQRLNQALAPLVQRNSAQHQPARKWGASGDDSPQPSQPTSGSLECL
jgi:hypothetical protein